MDQQQRQPGDGQAGQENDPAVGSGRWLAQCFAAEFVAIQSIDWGRFHGSLGRV